MLSAVSISELEQRLQRDSEFKQAFDDNPIEALRTAGMGEVADAMQAELDELERISEEIGMREEEDQAYRQLAESDPATLLLGAGVPVPAVEPILAAVGVPEGSRGSVPEVEAHLFQATTKARLLVLLTTSAAFLAFAQEAFADRVLSDERLKREVEPVANALERLAALKLS